MFVDAAGRAGQVFLEQDVPPALVFNDLKATAWVRASRPGLRLGLRIVFPEQRNPLASEPIPLTADLIGGECTTPMQWEQLTCQTTDTEVRKLLERLRAKYSGLLEGPDIKSHGMYVDRVVLVQDIERGSIEYFVDDLAFGPVINPEANGHEVAPAPTATKPTPALTIGDNRLLRKGQPFFPLIVPYHSEPLDALRRTAVNVVWTERYDDVALQAALNEMGLAAMATPPASQMSPASRETAAGTESTYNVGMPLFSPATSNVLFWMMGSRMDAAGLAGLRATADAVRDADPYRRPLIADVVESEREYHRTVDVLGFSKHLLHTSTSPLQFAEFLDLESRLALRGKPTFTWIQTETSDANLRNRPADAARPIIEPEQIWMQVYAALGAGVKGIGYWKRTPFGETELGDRERVSAVTLANLHIHVLHRWLATGKEYRVAPVRIGEDQSAKKNPLLRTLITQWDTPADAKPNAAAPNVQAYVIRCEGGWLVMPIALDADGQFQPGAMAIEDLRIFLRGVTAYQAWEVTTTSVHPYHLKLEETAGGTELRLSQFDQFAVIVIPDDPSGIYQLEQDSAVVRKPAGEAWVAIASDKLARVQDVHDQLQQLGAPKISNGDFVLAEARRSLKQAQGALEQQNYDSARLNSRRVLNLTRQVQRAHWDAAKQIVNSPVSTPYTICFQTLPDFYRLMGTIKESRSLGQNLLRGGDFENWDTIKATWSYDVAPSNDSMRVAVALQPSGVTGRALQLSAAAVNPEQPPAIVRETPARFITHPIPVFSGQIVRVRGKLWIEKPVTAHPDGLMFYDTLSGTVGALRWRADAPTRTWIPFELVRPVQYSGEMQLNIELRGLGDVRFDDLEVVVLEPASPGGIAAVPPGTQEATESRPKVQPAAGKK